MKPKNQRQYLVKLNCLGARLRVRQVVSARTSEVAWDEVLNKFFDAHPEILERGLSVGGAVAFAR